MSVADDRMTGIPSLKASLVAEGRRGGGVGGEGAGWGEVGDDLSHVLQHTVTE